MAKVIQNPIEVRLTFLHGPGWSVQVDAHYGVSADEYPDLATTRKGIPIQLTQAQQDTIIQVASAVVYPQILSNEGMN
jgi:hypothetical protein